MTITTREQLESLWELQKKTCDKGKHKFRDNSFGITFCTRCGYLSNKPSGIVLDTEDKLIVNIPYECSR